MYIHMYILMHIYIYIYAYPAPLLVQRGHTSCCEVAGRVRRDAANHMMQLLCFNTTPCRPTVSSHVQSQNFKIESLKSQNHSLCPLQNGL